jgi:phospholipase/carboxylesterase
MTEPLLDCIEIETGPNPQRSVIWLHGLGADGNDFASLVPELRLQGLPAVRFIFPHAPIQPVAINNGMAMRAWYDIYPPGSAVREDEAGLRASQARVQALIARENERGIASEHVVLAGFSQGCAMTLQTGLRHPQKLAGLLGLSGYLPLAALTDAERDPANQDTPVFLAHGISDPVIVLARAQDTLRWLHEHGYDAQLKTYPMPHSVCMPEVLDISDFLRRVLA